MKVNELLSTSQQLDEINLKHAMAAGVAGAALMSPLKGHEQNPPQQQVQRQTPSVDYSHLLSTPIKQPDAIQLKMAQVVTQKYSIDDEFAKEVVELAHKYEKPTFPKAKDILAIIGVESSFNPDAKSGLRRDPAVGLMQVRPRVWNMNPNELYDIENSIKAGSEILHFYFKKLHDRDSAVAAYNVGLSEFRSGNNAEGYVSKYQHELMLYKGIKGRGIKGT